MALRNLAQCLDYDIFTKSIADLAVRLFQALTRKDLSALMFVCNNVDPETLFSTEQPLPQAILLCILNQLAVKLEGETDLKFRYMIALEVFWRLGLCLYVAGFTVICIL